MDQKAALFWTSQLQLHVGQARARIGYDKQDEAIAELLKCQVDLEAAMKAASREPVTDNPEQERWPK